jgi:hypothetical protein
MNKNIDIKYNGKDSQKQERQKGNTQGYSMDKVC